MVLRGPHAVPGMEPGFAMYIASILIPVLSAHVACFGLGDKPSGSQGLSQALCLSITPSASQRTIYGAVELTRAA